MPFPESGSSVARRLHEGTRGGPLVLSAEEVLGILTCNRFLHSAFLRSTFMR